MATSPSAWAEPRAHSPGEPGWRRGGLGRRGGAASPRPPILLLSIAIGAVQLFSFLRGTARYAERLASHNLGLGLQAGLRAWLYRRLTQLVPCGLPGADRGDLDPPSAHRSTLARLVRAASRSWPRRSPAGAAAAYPNRPGPVIRDLDLDLAPGRWSRWPDRAARARRWRSWPCCASSTSPPVS